jgi:glycosyltransferase involved in cell wall biosynthesis
MRVSVVLATYNAEAYLAEAIDSLLHQSRLPDEIIVVDDGSDDGTRSVLDRYSGRILHVSQSHLGQTVALNRGISIASGELLGFHDADDLWCEKKLEHQLKMLESREEIDAIFGHVRQFVSPEVRFNRQVVPAPGHDVIPGGSKIAMLIRRATFDHIGHFDETFKIASFIEWRGRANRMGLRSVMLDEIVAMRRLHLANGGRTNRKAQDEETLLALKRLVDARRPLR